MIRNIFKKFKNKFPKRNKATQEKDLIKGKVINKKEDKSKNKLSLFEFEGKKFDLDLLDSEIQNIIELYKISISRINFFESLLTNLRKDRNDQIIKLKSKLKEETPLG
tara:strand:+ start:176 stop:499 length:324 start_codon:yes stop_codon:yes gene_type:complete